ncbi:carbohydrate ABC transporter ATP-binding protein (CUT1 family) [Tahibacter aquaticus]|uniref:Carbohydrate ABC transporter ATP-binding protein (CUT1 family) n=1 Tax=Tahibacter aquaticus TaxID=520092 RepID=A0A4R6Z9T6_9GAMM|nr:sn-glycerol-3-phosphate ABC transporter ATP-binding protein UgpC [Tahibacter aquaticus]TDR48680.1 carbohydrate ABC transporter ATP-binding protein (CUT1 family) [Tahibacter aquaticus]
MATVSLDGVRKVYANGRVAVAGASFAIAEGELLVLVGPSGCGKSTLLRMIAGLEDVSAGELCIAGKRVNELAPRDRDIAMVFQNYALYPHMSVAENLAFGLKLRATPKDEMQRRIATAAAMLGLQSMLKLRPAELSGGQRQRVALGRALVRQPKVFLLDEPLSNLDARLRAAMRVEIARLHRELGATMVYVTHDQVEAMTLGHRIVVMNDGAIQQIDTPLALYARPANVFVAAFLGSPGMNLLRGRVAADGVALELGYGLRLALGSREQVPAVAGEEIVVGLRPEDLAWIRPGSLSPAGVVEAVLDLAEPVGSETFLNLRLGEQALVARIAPGEVPAAGSRLRLAYAPQRLQYFAAGSGERLG